MANNEGRRSITQRLTPWWALRSNEAAPQDTEGESSGTQTNAPAQVRQTSYAPSAVTARRTCMPTATSAFGRHEAIITPSLLPYADVQQPATLFASPTPSPRPEAANNPPNIYQPLIHQYFANPGATSYRGSSSRGRPYRYRLDPRGRRRHPPFAHSLYNPTPQAPEGEGEGEGEGSMSEDPYDHELAMALHLDLLEDAERFGEQDAGIYDHSESDSGDHSRRVHFTDGDWDDEADRIPIGTPAPFGGPSSPANNLHRPFNYSHHHTMPGPSKRSRDSYEGPEGKAIAHVLNFRGAISAMLYNSISPNPQANDIWPECRSSTKLPAKYYLLDKSKLLASDQDPKHPPSKKSGKKAVKTARNEASHDTLPSPSVGRPKWKLPVELVEMIAEHLNRDDIKSLRLVSREMNKSVSQVIFRTVVVPFNTEIYGMLAQEHKPDFKGKKRARIEQPSYLWKNANGDEVYNGHGLDVFRGFGTHIRKFGMSFEVNEESLSMPPVKSLTEKKTSFWGNYDWPHEEYRRFDTVAGLENAADETPRMKTAFSELKSVRELALSIDSGLGWLNGPDRSIRARVLQKPSRVFGTAKAIPDRRAQAQQELWNHIEACHQNAGSDVRLATLYRMDGQLPLSELKDANNLADEQPQMPYLDPQLLHAATPYEPGDLPVPNSFEDPYVLERFVSTPPPSGTGILFSSIKMPSEGAHLVNPVIPAKLTKAQKEWLLETEWAQRAFMSSYMLSIIDNPTTFEHVHTLNISGLSDRYLPMLNRSDFWDALPELHNVTIMVIPCWRTVQKDEAGFVDAPKICPTQSHGILFDLLRHHVAGRANIRHLKVGFVTGGEHAEGLYARNKLLFPAPVMDMRGRSENPPSIHPTVLVATDAALVKAGLLQFPHVEQLVLNNCWITPPALREFVKMHDRYKLQTLVLDSVSLTGVLRPNANPHPQPAAFHNIMPPHLPDNSHIIKLNLKVKDKHQLKFNPKPQAQPNQQVQAIAQQHINFATVAQLAQQVHQLQTQLILGQQPQPLPALANNPAPGDAQSVLKAQPREGSWMDIIDQISPGTNLSDFGSEHSKADGERTTSLRTIEFVSCGYAKLSSSSFDQADVDPLGMAAHWRNQMLSKRIVALAPAMLSAKWSHLGDIVQDIDPSELAALDAAWDLRTGWEDAEAARAAEFDGMLAGGTGRFTGTIRHSDRVADEASAS
ncbi:hypothetical protein J4E85_005011 [Alternaria conjuncta]|uniref:uncharacterized protein n=1 Tax=Alternaria conjuncta TaxID=181017 RepID=UPI00221FC534|nr:uncharacterized protein J4E85_005011 [Alternaria conjuncta]KAI4930384.1 hypothetical protein J4E85_005011 [Alternaria conjuncta]